MKKYQKYMFSMLFSFKKNKINAIESRVIAKERSVYESKTFIEKKSNNIKDINNKTPINFSYSINLNELHNKEEELAKKMSYKKIVNLYTDLKNLTKKTARYFLIVKKYQKLQKKHDEIEYKKQQEKYEVKLKNTKKELINFISKNDEKLKILMIAAKFKKLEIDEELFNLTYKCALSLKNNKEKISTGETKFFYYTNKKYTKNDRIFIEKKIEELQEEIQTIKDKNIEIANSYIKINESNKIPKNYFKIYKKLSKLIEKSYTAQKIIIQEYSNNSKIQIIDNLKNIITKTHKETLEFIKQNKKEINEMLKKFPAQYPKNHFTLFSPLLLQKNLEFVHMTDICLYFILKGKIIPKVMELIIILENEDLFNNKMLKNVLKTLIKLENL